MGVYLQLDYMLTHFDSLSLVPAGGMTGLSDKHPLPRFREGYEVVDPGWLEVCGAGGSTNSGTLSVGLGDL